LSVSDCRSAWCARRIGVDGYAGGGGNALIPVAQHALGACEQIDLLAGDVESAVFGEEATVVCASVGTAQSDEGRDVEGSPEGDDGGIDGDGAHGVNGAVGGAASPGEAGWLEGFEADALSGARADTGAGAVAFGEADGALGGQASAALHAERVVERLRDRGDRLAGSVEDLDTRPLVVRLAGK